MNEMPQSVPASPAPDLPASADPVAAPVVMNPAPSVPVAAPVVGVNPAPVVPVAAPVVGVNPAPVVPVAAPVVGANPAPVSPANAPAAPVAVEPDYRAMYENLRRENEILRQNVETAQRAPVQGVSGGVVTVPNDDFIRGFDSDTW